MDILNKLVEETPMITEIQKDFYKVMLSERKEKILDYSMELLMKQELSQQVQDSTLELKHGFTIVFIKAIVAAKEPPVLHGIIIARSRHTESVCLFVGEEVN